MKSICFSVCFIGVFLIFDVFSWDLDQGELDIFEFDPVFSEEETTEDYPQYVMILNDNTKFNSEENEVESESKEPKTEVDILRGEEEPDESSSDFGPLPDFEPDLNTLSEKLDKLISDFKAQQVKIFELEEANKRLILKIDAIEQQTKTNSIILFNVQQTPNESSKTTLQRVLHVFNRIMRVRISARDIAVALRADTNMSNRNKPIIIRFTNFATKMKVLAVKNRLTHTEMTVSSDYSELVAQTRAALVPYFQRAKAEGHRAFILYNKLVVNGVAYSLEELQAQEEAKKNVAKFIVQP